jgi:hypothetical protein
MGRRVRLSQVEVATVEALKTAPIEAVKPTGEVIPATEVVQAPPVEMASAALPHTAGFLPLIGCFGLLSLGAAGMMKKFFA